MSITRKLAVLSAALAVAGTATGVAPGGAAATDEYNAVQPSTAALAVAQAMATTPGSVSGASWVSRPAEGNPTAIVTAPVSGFPTAGATAGMLSTGAATILTQPNDDEGSGQNLHGENVRGNTDYDVTILKIDFTVPAAANCARLDFRFLSEEYPEYVNKIYNDGFIAELDTSTWTTVDDEIQAPGNFAFDPTGSVISVDAAGNTSMTAGYGVGTTFDGGTPRLQAKTPITPGAHSLYLSIFDQGDHILDSAVIVDNIDFIATANPAVDCTTGATVLDPIIDDDFVPFAPKRLLETRQEPNQRTFDGLFEALGKRSAGSVTAVVVGGRGGVPIDAAAVALNVTAVATEGPGHVTVWPCGDEQPTASNLNYAANQTTPNAVITRIGVGGRICLYTKAAAHLVVDVNGFMPGTTNYRPIVPLRQLDTRDDDQPAAAGTITEVRIADGFEVPEDAAAAVLNVTAVAPDGPGYVTVFPCDADRPNASSVNYAPGAVVPGMVVVKLSGGDQPGRVCLYTKAAAHLLVDVAGYFPPGASFHSLVPQRLLDTRGLGTADGDQNGGGAAAAGGTVVVQVRDRAGVPANASAVALNVIATGTAGRGYVTVYPCGTDRPWVSGVNYEPGDTRSNTVVSQVGADGTVCLYTLAGAHLVADITGYFVPG